MNDKKYASFYVTDNEQLPTSAVEEGAICLDEAANKVYIKSNDGIYTFSGENQEKHTTRFGEGTTATGNNQFVVGKYNKDNPDALFTVGNGDATNPHNAFEVLKDGQLKYNGQLDIATGVVTPKVSFYDNNITGYLLNKTGIMDVEIDLPFKPCSVQLMYDKSVNSVSELRDLCNDTYTIYRKLAPGTVSMINNKFLLRYKLLKTETNTSGLSVESDVYYTAIGKYTNAKPNILTLIDIDNKELKFEIESEEPKLTIKRESFLYTSSEYVTYYLDDKLIHSVDSESDGSNKYLYGLSNSASRTVDIAAPNHSTSEPVEIKLDRHKDYTYYIVSRIEPKA